MSKYKDLEKEFPADFDKPEVKRLTEREMRAEKHALHELPANYAPPRQRTESAPLVVDKRVVIWGAVICLLIVVGAIGYKLYQNSKITGANEVEMQLTLGNGVKRNMDGGTWATLSLPADLATSDLIKTGSDRRNVVTLPDGSSIRLDYATTIKINSVEAVSKPNSSDKPETYNVNITLHKGALFVDEHGSTQVTIETKYARFTPVGTRYGVTQLERKDLTEQSVVNVVEGTVSMSHLDDPNSQVLVTAGKQAAATSQSLIKPRKAEKNDWMNWNSKWREADRVPTLKNAKLRPGDDSTQDAAQREDATYVAPSDYTVGNRRSSQPTGGGNVPSEPSGANNVEPQSQAQDNSGGETLEQREAREASERLEAEQRRIYEERRRIQEQKANEQREKERANEELRRAQERQQQANAKANANKANAQKKQNQKKQNSDPFLDGSMVAPEDTLHLPTGNLVDPNQSAPQAPNDQQQNQGGAQPNNGYNYAPAQHPDGKKGMMPIGDSDQLDARPTNSHQLDARVGNSNSLDAHIGDSSSMDAKTGDMW